MLYKKHSILLPIFCISLLLLLLIVLLNVFSSPPKIIMSYFVPENAFYAQHVKMNDSRELQKRIDRLTVIAYAFLKLSPDGKIIFGENDLSRSESGKYICKNNLVICNNPTLTIGNFNYFSSFQNQNHRLEKIISFGGADDKTSFFYAIEHPDSFANSLNTVIKEFHLSGIDLDFEINRLYTREEAIKYAILVTKLRKKLGPNTFISLATIIDPETLLSLGKDNWKVIAENVDGISMMCYDLISPFSKPSNTQFSSNLYLVSNAPKFLQNANQSCNKSILYLASLGVPKAKIILGVPAFAIAFGGVNPTNHGLFQSSDLAKTPSFDDMGKGLLRYSTVLSLRKAGFNQYTALSNDHIVGVWSYNPESHQFITFDTPRSVRDKTRYVLKNKLAGIMLWRMGQDMPVNDKESLLKTIAEDLGQ